MNNLEQREYDLSARLAHYSSGDGSLSFVFQKTNREGERIATGDKVTIDDVKTYVLTRDPHLLKYKILNQHGELKLYNPCLRLDDRNLVMDGRKYRYCLVFCGDSWDVNFVYVFCERQQKWHETKHLSTIAALDFYVQNEELIKEQEHQDMCDWCNHA